MKGARLVDASDPRYLPVTAKGCDNRAGMHGATIPAINAGLQARFRPVRGAGGADTVAPMPKRSDTTSAASEIENAQRRRLRVLRRLATDYQVDAAEAAGVSEHSWGRMERGPTAVDPVALARFCAAYGLPAEYVITGGLSGFDRTQMARVLELEAADQVAAISAEGRTGARQRRRRESTPEAGGKPRQRKATVEG